MISQSLTSPENNTGHNRSNGLDEKRRHERLDISVDGEINFGNAMIPVHMLDLSKSGAMLKMATEPISLPKIGEAIDVALVWPLSAGSKKLHVEARLVRIIDMNIAVEFTHLSSIEPAH